MADPKKPGADPISLRVRATIEGYGGDTDPAHQVRQEWSVIAEALWSDDQGEGSEQVGEAKGCPLDFALLDGEYRDLGGLHEELGFRQAQDRQFWWADSEFEPAGEDFSSRTQDLHTTPDECRSRGEYRC